MGGGGGGGGQETDGATFGGYAKSILCTFLQDFQQLVSDKCRPFCVAYYNNTCTIVEGI